MSEVEEKKKKSKGGMDTIPFPRMSGHERAMLEAGCPLSAENRNFRQNFMTNVGGGGKKKSQKGGSRQSPSPDWVVMSGPCWRLPTECGEP